MVAIDEAGCADLVLLLANSNQEVLLCYSLEMNEVQFM